MTTAEPASQLRARLRRFAALLVLTTTGCGGSLGLPATYGAGPSVELGPRPFYLLDRLTPGPLRDQLETCRQGPFRRSRFSIGHRGAPLQFPEHTRESYLAATRMGAGVVECDVTFTRDRELVCRHSQCDLATTTNILETPLAARCSQGFRGARFEPETGELALPAGATCCTSDLTLAEFKQLEGRMDASDPRATTVAEFLSATPRWRTDLYANGGTLMTHRESVELLRSQRVGMTPELKEPSVPMPFGGGVREGAQDGGFSRRDFARRIVDAYRGAGIPPSDVALQSFDHADLLIWQEIAPEFAAHALWLVDHDPALPSPDRSAFEALLRAGVRTIAPPISVLLVVDSGGELRASEFAERARAAGLEIVAWTVERSGRIRNGHVEGAEGDFYLGPIQSALMNDGDVYRVIHALVQEVGVKAIFSDWPATTTYYANCFGLD